MSPEPTEREQRTLQAVRDVQEELRRQEVQCVLIGALALAHHGYVRATEDVDLAVRATLAKLSAVAHALRAAGYEATLEEPDGDDPLGGVLTVTGNDFDPIQIVNFEGRFPRLVDDALKLGTSLEHEDLHLRVVDLQTLILFKLYAGGYKSASDVLELLSLHPEVDLAALRDRAQQVRLGGALEKVLALRDA